MRVSRGEQKARRAKKKWLKPTRFGHFYCEKIYQPWFTILGFNSKKGNIGLMKGGR